MCVAYHPFHHEIAAGFENGRVRVFDVATTSLIQVGLALVLSSVLPHRAIIHGKGMRCC